MHFIEKFKDGDRISDVYLCKSKSTALTKSGKEYENVMLQDKTGQMDSKIWTRLPAVSVTLMPWIMLQ